MRPRRNIRFIVGVNINKQNYKTMDERIIPYFSKEEMEEIISFTSMCIARAVKNKQFSVEEWDEYLTRWNQSHYYPEEILDYIKQTICQTLKTLDHE